MVMVDLKIKLQKINFIIFYRFDLMAIEDFGGFAF